MADMATSGGGLHPGRPVIWPTGKPTSSSVTPEATQAKQTQQSQASQASQSTQASQSAQQAMKTQAQSQKQVTREVTVKDLKQLLTNQKIAVNDLNLQIASMMLRYGMEVSNSSFTKVMNMMSQTDKSVASQEAAILLSMKGIESPEATKTLAQFLKENPRIASQLMNIQANIADLQAALGMAKGVLPAQLMQALSSLLSQYGDEIPGIPKKFRFSGSNSTGRKELLNDMRAMKSFLSGVTGSNSLPDTAEGQIVSSNIMSTIEGLDKAIANIMSQSFLSKQAPNPDVNYSYYQIPNNMVKPPQTVEIIIKRDGKSGGKTIDPKDTTIILALDTTNMGRIAINMKVLNKKVEFVFNTQNAEVKDFIKAQSKELASALSDKDFMAAKMDVNVNPSMCTVSPPLIPFLGLEDLMMVDASA